MTRPRKLETLPFAHYVYGDRRTAWLVVKDPSAGLRNAYTVYRILLAPLARAHVIGRELPLALARKVVREDRDSRP